MKKATKTLTLVLAVLMAGVLLAGCAGGTPAASSAPPAASSEAAASAPASDAPAPAADANKVAVILSGPISDMSWNATAYNGLLEIEKMGAEIAYQENVDNSNLADAMNTYATGGFNIIFLSTNSYEEIGLEVAKDYPDVTFMIINGATTQDNVYSIQVADEHQGFMMGAIAALTTQSQQVGFVGGMEITPIINGQKGFEAGVAYVNENVKANTAMTGSMTDVNGAKEQAKAILDAGADVIAPMADNASLGVLEAAQEAGAKAVGSGASQQEVAPDAVMVEVIKDTAIAYKAAYTMYLEGNLSTTTNKMGVKEGVVFLSDWYAAADDVDQSVKDEVQKIYDELAAGNITIDLA